MKYFCTIPVFGKNFNVIYLDWKQYSLLEYGFFSQFIERIGKAVGSFINKSCRSLPKSKIILVGHGDGAHIAGVAGKATRGEIGRIFALDPIDPEMDTYYSNSSRALSISDAEWVEVVQTSAMGTYKIDADRSWVLNGGCGQPGCDSKLRWKRTFCDHFAALRIIAQTADPDCVLLDTVGNAQFGLHSEMLDGHYEIKYNFDKC